MGLEPAIATERQAMECLGWDTTRLYVATVALGSVGTLDELRRHVATGAGLGPAERAVLAATLHEALRDCGQSSPFAVDGARPA